VGSALSMTSTSPVTLTSEFLGNLPCESTSVPLELTVNSGGTIEMEGRGAGSAQGCTRSGSPITVSKFDVANISTTTSGTGTMSFVFSLTINTTTCNVRGTNVPFSFAPGDDTIRFYEAKGINSPSCGSFKLQGEFKLATAEGGAVLLR